MTNQLQIHLIMGIGYMPVGQIVTSNTPSMAATALFSSSNETTTHTAIKTRTGNSSPSIAFTFALNRFSVWFSL